MMTDVLYSLRTLWRARGFTTVAIVTIALGIGANTAIFSVVHAVLLRPLPYGRPGELVALYESLPARRDEPARPRMALAPATTRDWAASSSFASISPYAENDFILTGAGEPERIRGASVAWTFFDTMAAAPIAGRLLAREDDGPNLPLVAIVGHDLWRTRFGGDTSTIGRTIELSGRRHMVVGVMQPGFSFPSGAQIWVPLSLDDGEYADDQRLSFYLRAVARLRPGISVDAAAADLNAIASGLARQFPKQYEGRGATVLPLHESIVGEAKPALVLLAGTAGFVLLIACVNVANLLLAQSASREAEMAIRAALGASRRRLVRQTISESLVLAAPGALGGVLLAMWSRDVIVALSPATVPRMSEVRIDGWVLAFALILTVVSAAACSIAPALAGARRSLNAAVSSQRKGSLSAGRLRAHGLMVIAQLALSLALLTGAGLLARTFYNLVSVEPGFDAAGVMTMEVVLPRPKYPEPSQRAAFFSRVVEMLEDNPLVASAGGTTNLPLSSSNMSYGFYRQGMVPDRDAPLIADVRGITPGYFDAMRIPLLRGRGFSDADRDGSTPVVIINDAMRRTFWPDRDPIGDRVSITRGRTVIWREIVGVIGDVRHAGLGTEPAPELYMPYTHDPFMFMRIAVRSDAQPEVLAGIMRAAVWAADPHQPVSRVRPMSEVVATSISSERFQTVLVGTFAVLALALAAVGLYGVVSYSVTLRLREFGVRLALGARPGHVIGLVLRQGLVLGLAGLALGLGIAMLLTRLIAARLYQTTTTDPATFAGVSAVLLAVALVASYVPARRAVRADPMSALRAE
jgi:predicted permease